MQVTLRVYKDVAAFPGLYKFDYEVDNASVSSFGDQGVSGIGNVWLFFPTPVADIGNVYVPVNWASQTDGTFLQVYSQSGPNGLALAALAPGASMHFGFTTFPRKVANENVCSTDANGNFVRNSCAVADKVVNAVPQIAPLRPQQAPPVRSIARVAPEALLVRPDAVCAQFELSGKIGLPGAPKLRVTQKTSALSAPKEIASGDTVDILTSPEMPAITARLAGASSSDTISFQMDASDAYGDDYKYPSSGPAVLPANQAFSVPKSPFYGGKITITWTYNGEAQDPFQFNILGIPNPDPAGVVQPYIQGLGGAPWMTLNIGIHENGLKQFVESGANLGLPGHDAAGGYGIMQLTNPAPTTDEKWNWQSNIARVVRHLRETDAYGFWRRQVKLWSDHNMMPGVRPIPPPNDQPESSNCTFTLSPASGATLYTQNPPYSVPYPDPNHFTDWFGDAIMMKAYAGLGSVAAGGGRNYIRWIESPPPAHWSEQQSNKDSLGHGTDDIVYQFCTCKALSGGCQHSGSASPTNPF